MLPYSPVSASIKSLFMKEGLMAIFLVSLRQSHDMQGQTRRKWSNTFFVDAPNAAAAAAWGVALWQGYLREAVRERVWCYEVYATSLQEGDDSYAVQGVPEAQQRGTLPAGSGEPYGREYCVSVTIPAEEGRPSRKFWRPGLTEGDITNGETISLNLVNTIEYVFNSALSEVSAVDPDGQALTGPVRARLSLRRLGRESAENLPAPPPLG